MLDLVGELLWLGSCRLVCCILTVAIVVGVVFACVVCGFIICGVAGVGIWYGFVVDVVYGC